MTAKTTIRLIGDDALIRQLKAIKGGAAAVLPEVAQAGAIVIRDLARPKAPGPHIEQELTDKNATRATAEIGPDDEHWHYRYMETGAGGHPIPGPLAFYQDGQLIVVPAVSHPGMAAAPFLRPAADEGAAPAQKAMGDQWRSAIAREAGP